MGQLIRSAKGDMVDFELLAIKQQLASAPVPKVVEDRKLAIDIKDGAKVQEPEPTAELLDADYLAVSKEAADSSGQAKQLKRK